MKHLHILMAVITIGIFLYQFAQVLMGKSGQLPNKGLKIGTHIVYTLLLIAGVVTLMPYLKVGIFTHWVVAKLVLFGVAISSTIKATRLMTPSSQAKIGMFVALIAYMGIVTLAIVKPANLF